MATTLTAKTSTYKTNQGDMWDMIGLRCHGDEHTMHFIQDFNFEYRFTDAFSGSVILQIPLTVTVQNNLKTRRPNPNLSQMLPWLSPKGLAQ